MKSPLKVPPNDKRVKMPDPPLNLDEHISYQLKMLTNLISQVTSDVSVRQSGLTEREWRVMGMLGTKGAMMPAQLASETGMDRATITRAIGQLEAMGYVLIAGDEADKRRKVLYLTDRGVATCDQIRPDLTARGLELQAVLTKKELKYYYQIMGKLRKRARHMLTEL